MTLLTHLTPAGIRPPFAKYSHGVEVPDGMRLVVQGVGEAREDRLVAYRKTRDMIVERLTGRFGPGQQT